MSALIQVRRGTASQWTSANPTLGSGEIGFETDTFKIKIGNGSTAWTSLQYAAGGNQFDTNIVFEGATADSFETTLQATDPTADRTITLPDATGTVITTGNLSSITSVGTLDSLTVTGDLTVNGTTTTINSTAINVNNQVVFEGTTADAFETTLTVVDPTADRTITFPNSTGTVALTTDIPSLTGYVTETGTQTLTNKTLTTPVITSISNSGTITVPTGTLTLATVTGTETLTNKTLASALATTALTLNGTAELRLADTDSSHYVGFKSPATVATNRIWTLPSADGTSGQVLQTNGSGTLTFATAAATGAGLQDILMMMGA